MDALQADASPPSGKNRSGQHDDAVRSDWGGAVIIYCAILAIEITQFQ